MAERGSTELEKASERGTGLVSAFQSVTDGVLDLLKTHLELAKAEARQEVKAYGSEATRAAVGLVVALFGFGFFNLSIVCAAGYFGGLAAMAITALIQGTVYMWFGGQASRGALRRMKERDSALVRTKDEIKRSTEWVKEIRETS